MIMPCIIFATITGQMLGDAMGFYGGEHFDSGDAIGYYSNMSPNSDIPDDHDPGCFFILELGSTLR